MADLGITIAEKLIEVTASAVVKEICDMWGYKSQLEDLNKTVSTIKNVLLDADSKRELSKEESGYIDELKAVVYDVDDLFDEFVTLAELKLLRPLSRGGKLFEKVRCFFTSQNQAGQAYRMSRQVKEIRKQLDGIVNNHKNFSFSVDYKPICNRREETCSYVDAGDIIGREDDKKAVIDMLLGPNDNVHQSFRFVTIVGVGGLGKTALAQLVCNDKTVKAAFPDPNLRLWVCVSDQDGEQFDVKVILCKILEIVTDHKPDSNSTMEWVQKQFQEQLRGKKYLLFLDDVWTEDPVKWHSLRKFLTLGQEGSRIVVTTRSERTAEIIGKKHMYKLQGLSEQNSRLLFESVAFDKAEQEQLNHPDLVDIGKKIVEKCYNVPLAIKVVGSLLFGQPMNKWQTFEHSGFAGIGNGDNEIMSILKLSYHNLRPSLKNCFSYCALFPKDFQLNRKELISLWMAQGYIVSLDRDQSIEDAAEEHFLILVRRCFFQDVEKDKHGNIGSVKIHDLMHDVALDVGREETGVMSSNTTDLGDKVRHVYYVGDCPKKFYFKTIKSKIRSFISRYDHSYNHSITVADTRIDSLMCLRVLCLQRVSGGIKGLCDSIGKLLHLRYLDLSWNYRLEALSDSIIGLHNLQTLNLHSCEQLRELPKDFSKLVKLRQLNLSSCRKLTDMPCMDRLTNLRHLNLSNCCELSSLPSGVDKLTSLRHFDLSNCRRLSSVPTSIGELTSLGHFDLSNCRRLSSMPTSIGQLTSLRLFDLSSCRRLISMPTSIGELTNLRYFDLSSTCLELTSMPSGMGKLTNLRVLPLFVVGMEKRVATDEVCMGELKDLKPLTNLKGGLKIKIGKFYKNDGEGEYLKGLKYLTQVQIGFYGVQNEGCIEWEGVMEKLEPPSNVKELNILGYKGTIIPRWGRAEDNWALSLPHLVKISLYRCSNLEQIPSLSKLRNLKSLHLDSLYKLEYMENTRSNNGDDLTAFFPSLESLDIRCLDSFKGWWREDELVEDDHILTTFPHLSNLVIMACPKLTSFRSLEDLGLDEVGNSQGDVRLREVEIDDVGLVKAIPSHCLTSLHLTCDEKVESLSEIGDVFRKYKYTCSLRSLRVSYCSKMRRVGTGGLEHLTASLQSLEIIGCPELEKRCKEPNGEDWPKIQHIPNVSFRRLL